MKYKYVRNLSSKSTGVEVDIVSDTQGEMWIRKTYNVLNGTHLIDKLHYQFLMEVFCSNHFVGNSFVAQIHEVIVEKNKFIFIMELLDNTLSYIITTKYYNTEHHIKHLMIQMLMGLAAIHANGIYHSDIKPDNIGVRFSSDSGMVDGRWMDNGLTIKYIDFGLALLTRYPYNINYTVRGPDHHYTPPECKQSRAIGKVGISGDIYSMGIVFYYLINPSKYDYVPDFGKLYHLNNTGLLFDPSTIDWKLVHKIVGSDGVDLLEKMLEIDPDKRITAIDALKHPFFGEKHKQTIKNGYKHKHKQIGGNTGYVPTRTPELPFLPTKTQFMTSQNEYQYLPYIISRKDETMNDYHANFSRTYSKKELKIMYSILNKLHSTFMQNLDLSFEMINYAMYLFQLYIANHRSILPIHDAHRSNVSAEASSNRPIRDSHRSNVSAKASSNRPIRDAHRSSLSSRKWFEVSLACMLLAAKLMSYGVDNFRDLYTDHKIHELEIKICQSMKWKLPHPLFVTKEPMLLDHYLRLIYAGKGKPSLSRFIKPLAAKRGLGHFYEFYLINMLSSLFYMHPVLLKYSKHEQVMVILSFFFDNIEHNKNLRRLVVKLIKHDNKEMYSRNEDLNLIFEKDY